MRVCTERAMKDVTDCTRSIKPWVLRHSFIQWKLSHPRQRNGPGDIRQR